MVQLTVDASRARTWCPFPPRALDPALGMPPKKFVQCNLGMLGTFCSLHDSSYYYDQEQRAMIGPIYRGAVMAFFFIEWLGSADPQSSDHYVHQLTHLSFCDTAWYDWVYYALRNLCLIQKEFAPLFGPVALCSLPPNARASLRAIRSPSPWRVRGRGRTRSRSPSFPPGNFGSRVPAAPTFTISTSPPLRRITPKQRWR